MGEECEKRRSRQELERPVVSGAAQRTHDREDEENGDAGDTGLHDEVVAAGTDDTTGDVGVERCRDVAKGAKDSRQRAGPEGRGAETDPGPGQYRCSDDHLGATEATSEQKAAEGQDDEVGRQLVADGRGPHNDHYCGAENQRARSTKGSHGFVTAPSHGAQ